MSEDKVQITIDGQTLEAPKGAMLIEVTDKADIAIPRFCYHKKLSIAANCRMCLVDVEKAPKPLPACATPVMDGMVVHTRSARALQAQKATMEFLLINHPLDCPICDQGGECELQDVSYLYGKDVSQYSDSKRVVVDKNIGPLIATEFTRCIQCTRCVRFGDEIAGMRELGATGRGDSMTIGTYIQKSVDSELSGNVIDICPVGALTAKPSRFKARAWELQAHKSIAAHDCVGSNITVHTAHNTIIRVVPHENEAINETWLSDRDRFSYQGFDTEDRKTTPMVKRNGSWQEVDWSEALEEAANEMELVIEKHGAENLAALASANSTLEELYLLQKLMRAKGCNNIDHRLFQIDFSNQHNAPVMPWLGMEIAELENLDAVLLVASNIRKEQPLLNSRLKKAVNKGASISSLNCKAYPANYRMLQQRVVSPRKVVSELALLCQALADLAGATLDNSVQALCNNQSVTEQHKVIAESLSKGENSAIIVGSQAVLFADYSHIRALSQTLADLSNSKLSIIAEDSNTAGAWLAGFVPHRLAGGEKTPQTGLNASEIMEGKLKGYLLLNMDADYDSANPQGLIASLEEAESVIAVSPYLNEAMSKVATVFLPIGTCFETSGTRVNCSGQWQSFKGAIAAKGESRPGWKVLRVLANTAAVEGFDYLDSADVRKEIQSACENVVLENRIESNIEERQTDDGMICFGDRNLYAVDQLVRRAEALQKTTDALQSQNVRLSPATAKQMNIANMQKVNLVQDDTSVVTMVEIDDSIADDCLWVPLSGYAASKLKGSKCKINVEAI